MKKYLLLLILPLFILTGCSVGRTTETKGVENYSYLHFTRGGAEKYAEGVTVFVDNQNPFFAEVDDVDSRTVKGNIYIIKTGKSHIRVEYKGGVLYEKDVFVSSQETKSIQLP